MTVDRTTTGDTDAEAAEQPADPERRTPADNPGTDGVPSRADSRAGAAAASKKPDDGPPEPEQPAGTQENSEVTDEQGPAAGRQALDSDEVDEPGTDDQTAEESQGASLSARDARRAVVNRSHGEEAAAAHPPEAVAKDQIPQADVSDDRSNTVQRAGERQSRESVPVASGERGTSPQHDGPGTFDPADKAVVTEVGGWEWKGLVLTPEDNAVADSAIEVCRAAEGRDSNDEYGEQGLTPQMRGVEQELAYGELVPDTERYAVKGEDRFKEKLAKKIALEPDKSTAELAAEIHDGIRYTFIFPAEKYTDGVYDAEGRLRQRGYDLRQRKPSWGDGGYKGVNSRWSDPGNGVLFEVQFHTPQSWEAKQKTHDAYAMIENPDSSDADKAAARRYQQEVSAAVPVPEGADEIPPYTDERH